MRIYLLNGIATFLAIAHPDDLIQRNNEYLAVPHLALAARSTTRPANDGVDGGLDEVLIDGNIEPHLANEVYLHGLAAEILRVAFLPAVPLDVGHGQAEHLDGGQFSFNGVEPVRLNDCDD